MRTEAVLFYAEASGRPETGFAADRGSVVIRLSKLADYGIVIVTQMARKPDHLHTTPGLSATTGIPQPMASKVLKALTRDGVVVSTRGAKGGYSLARPAAQISIADVIAALDGPIALTACIEDGPGGCEIEALCPARTNWQRINDAIRGALAGITVAEMAFTVPSAFAVGGRYHDRAIGGLGGRGAREL